MNTPTPLSPTHRATHTYVIGQSGTGKSRAMESWIMQDILAGHGVGVIDPHGDLFHNLLNRLASYPDTWKRLVLIDPTNKKWTIGINPLEPINGLPLERTALFMTDVMMKIWKFDQTSAPRMLWIVSNTFLALADLGLSLNELPVFLTDVYYRENRLEALSQQRVRDYFTKEFPKQPNTAQQWVSPVLNKIGALLFDPDIRPMLSSKKTINLRKVLDEELILLVNLSKGLLGEGASSMLGAFIVARLQSVALSRADTNKRPPFYLYMDEFQNYTTDNIKDILSESRKYGLSITFAHQYLNQLPKDILAAVLNTSGTIVSFRIGYHDSQQLVKDIFPSSNFGERKNQRLKISQQGLWPKLDIEKQVNKRNWEHLTQDLASLKNREFWVKLRGISNPTKHRSFDMPDVKITPIIQENRERMIDQSGVRFGYPKKRLYNRQDSNHNQNKRNANTSNPLPPSSVPLWDH